MPSTRHGGCLSSPLAPSLLQNGSFSPCSHQPGLPELSGPLWHQQNVPVTLAAALQLLWANPTCSRAAHGSQSLGQCLKIIPFLPFCTCGHPQSSHPQLAFLLFLPNSPWLKGEDLGVFEGQFSSAAADVFIAGVEDQAQGNIPTAPAACQGKHRWWDKGDGRTQVPHGAESQLC